MRIYTLENKNSEVLAILTHEDNMSYREFVRLCDEANTEANNNFFILKDMLLNDYRFKLVENVGGYDVSKKKGSI